MRNFVNIMQIRERNEEGMGRGSKKTDYGGFFGRFPFTKKNRKISIGNFHLGRVRSICHKSHSFTGLLKVALRGRNQSGAEKDNRLLFREQ